MLLANLVLLAHAVVPHHHHHEQVCINNTCCREDVMDHEHNTPEHNHQHDGGKNTAACVLKQEVVLPSNQGRQECDFVNSTDNHSYDFLFTLFNSGAETGIPDFHTVASTPDITFSYSVHVTNSSGSRAPPTV